MSESHVRRELWAEVADGVRSGEELMRRIGAHLAELCPTCAVECTAFDRAEEERLPPAGDFATLYERAAAGIRRAEEEVREDRRSAEEALQELLSLPPGRRLDAVREGRQRFQGPALGERLLERARSQLPGYPLRAFAFARLAQAVLQHTPVTPYAVQLYSLAVAHMGNARRVVGELPEAEQYLEAARFLYEAAGDADPLAAAELDHLVGSLRRDQRRLEEALCFLRRAEASYREQKEAVRAARVLLTVGLAEREAGELEAAVRATEAALEILASEEEPRLRLYALHNLADFFHDLGWDREALQILEQNRGLLRRCGDPLSRLRFLWVEGHVARGLGELGRAEGAYRLVRREFARRELHYDAALATLDLATLLAEDGRTAEVRALAEEIAPVFEACGVHREAAAALLMFVESARSERVALNLLQDLAAYLRAARHNPNLPFRRSP